MTKFQVGDLVILNEKIERDLPTHSGDVVEIVRIVTSSPNFQYDVMLPNGDFSPVRECELNELTSEQKELIAYINNGYWALYKPTDSLVRILKVDYLNCHAEVEHMDYSTQVVNFDTLRKLDEESGSVQEQQEKLGYFAELGLEVGKLVDEKQKAYGDSVTKCYEIMKVLLQDYHDEKNHTYTIPESLLEIMLLDVRKIDKLNRRFSNPDGDLMNENPFKDDVGYSLLGMRMVDDVK